MRFSEADRAAARAICNEHSLFLDDIDFQRRCSQHAARYFPGYETTGLAAFLLSALHARRPLSLIRVGDGEGNVLRLSPDFGAEPAPLDEKCFDALFGMMNATHLMETYGEKVAFAQELAIAVRRADIVGFRATWHGFPPERDIISSTLEAGSVRGALGILYARRYEEELLRANRLATAAVTFAHCHLSLLDHLPALLDAAQSVIVITGRATLRSEFQKRIGSRLADFIPIPLENAHCDGAKNSHYYADFARIMKRLSDGCTGALVLVGAGIFGKLYCHAAREGGGIAVDIGSAMDLLAGLKTRPIHDGYAKYAWTSQ
jgi:hypothetical protein